MSVVVTNDFYTITGSVIANSATYTRTYPNGTIAKTCISAIGYGTSGLGTLTLNTIKSDSNHFTMCLIGGGGSGGKGINYGTFDGRNYNGGGGGGGAILAIKGTASSSSTTPLVYGSNYNFSIGKGGIASASDDGDNTFFGQNIYQTDFPNVGGGRNGYSPTFTGDGSEGSIVSKGQTHGFIDLMSPGEIIEGGSGGSGGDGNNATYGPNTIYPGSVYIPYIRKTTLCGGGGGGNDTQGGSAGQGFGGSYGGHTGQHVGENASSSISIGSVKGGAGGGGGGAALQFGETQGGNGADGIILFSLTHIFTYKRADPIPYNEYSNLFILGRSDNVIVEKTITEEGNETCECGIKRNKFGVDLIFSKDNTIEFGEELNNHEISIFMNGSGGGGGGSWNDNLPVEGIVDNDGQWIGEGGAGAGALLVKATVGISNGLNIGQVYNIGVGEPIISNGLEGVGIEDGASGSNSIFKEQQSVSNLLVATGGEGGKTRNDSSVASIGGTISYDSSIFSLLNGGNGGNGGTIATAPSTTGQSGTNAAIGTEGLPGVYKIDPYYLSSLSLTTGGGGGAGGGSYEASSQGNGGDKGNGIGGVGGILGSTSAGDDADNIINMTTKEINTGNGGGGAGMASINDAYAIGGLPSNGVVIISLKSDVFECNPTDAICGCVLSKCPEKPLYKLLKTAENDPKISANMRFSQYIRAVSKQGGYSKVEYGNKVINEYGRYPGAPGGSGQPPRNRFN